MHELSICYALLDQVEQIARERDAVAVEKILLKIGPLSGVEADLLQKAWPLAAAGTVAEHAELAIDEAEIRVRCSECDGESIVPANRLLCSHCGGFRTRLVSGEDMILQRVELSGNGSLDPAPCRQSADAG